MTLSWSISAVPALGALALAGAFLGAVAAEGPPPDPGDSANSAAPRSAEGVGIEAAEPFLPTCGQGPRRVSEFTTTREGYLRARRSGPTDHREFVFARAIYSDGGGGGFFRRGGDVLGDGGPAWSIDYPSADHHMMLVARRLSNLDACEWGHPISLADPNLRRFPFVYSLEWGYASLTPQEVKGLRDYLTRGGLLMIDDFWGTAQYANVEWQLRQVLPDHQIVDIPRSHLLFRSYYTIEGDIVQVPGARNGRDVGMGFPGARTWEQDGYEAFVRGILDDSGRIMVVLFGNTDLGDALEWAEDPYYPLEFSTYASQLFLNTIIYAMTQ